MGRRKIEGSHHVRRKMRLGARIAIGVAMVALLSTGGYFLTTKSGISLNLKKDKTTEIAIENSHDMDVALAGLTPDAGSSVNHSLIGISKTYNVTAESSTLTSTGEHDETPGGSIVMSERNVDDGHGGSVKLITLDAMAKHGYTFIGWSSADGTGTISDSNKINIIADSTYYVGESAIRIYDDKTFYAVFRKNSAISLEPLGGTANGDTYGYTLYTYPALGSIYIDAGWKDDGTDRSYTNLQYGGSNWWWENNNGKIQIDHVNFQLRYPYTQAVTMWPVDQMNHSDDDHHDSYSHNKSVKASFALYIYDGSTYYGRSMISRYCQLGDSYNSTNDAVFDIKLTDSDVLGDAAKDPHSFNIYVVPLMQQGTNYQVYVSSDDSKRGRAAGTASSPVPFTTSIKAFPFEGFDFDYWRFHTIDSYNYTYIYDESTYNANIQTQEVSFYTACFKPATYKVYGSNLPSDGGTIKVKGNVMTTAKDITTVAEDEDEPGKLDYCYTYNTDSDSSSYEKVTAKPKVHVTITPNPGYEIESWSYVLEDIGTVTGDSAEFDIVDFEEDINLTVKYTNGKARIEVESSPVTGGTATVQKGDSGTPKYDYEEFLPGQEDAILKATPIDDAHMFLYWKDTNGQKYENSTLTLSKVASGEKFTAYFAPKTVNIKTAVYPTKDGDKDITAGTVTVTGDAVVYDSTNNLYTATPNTSVTIRAQDGNGYHFQKFIDSASNEYTTNPLIKTDIISDVTYTAVFVPDTFDINAQASPVTGGKVTVNDREGSNTVKYNDTVILKAIPTPNEAGNSDFEFRFFEDQNGNRYSGDIVKDSEGNDTNQRQFTFLAVNGAENYKAVFAPKKVNIDVDVDPVEMKDGAYVAGKYDVTYTPVDGGSAKSNPHTTGDSINNIKGQTDVKIRAIPLNGYHFVRFVDKKGQNYTDNPLILHDVVEDENITIVFDNDELTVNALSSPYEGGTVTINGKAGTQKVKYEDSISLVATPYTGYMFRYFEDEDGNIYKGEPLLDGNGSYRHIFTATNPTATYKAVFVRKQYALEMLYDPDDTTKGGVEVTYQKLTDDSTMASIETKVSDPGRHAINDVKGLTDIRIKAIEKTGYRFSRFVDGKGNIYKENPLILTSITEDQSITAIFVPDEFEISAQATPVDGGTVTVGVPGGADREGSNTVKYRDSVTLKAIPKSDEYIFRYFEDENGNRYKGTSGTGGVTTFTFLAVNGPEKYMAVFSPKAVSYTIDVDPVELKDNKYVAGNYEVTYTKTGSTAPGDPIRYDKKTVIGDVKGQTDIKIRAIPLNGYHFVRFVDSKGNNYTDNPLILHDVVADERITIVFDNDELTVNAVSSPDEGGTVTINEKAGTQKVDYDSEVTLVATPRDNYMFRYFQDDDGNIYKGIAVGDEKGSYKHTFKAVNSTTTYKAVFVRKSVELDMKYDPVEMQEPSSSTSDVGAVKGGVVVTYRKWKSGSASETEEIVLANPTRNEIKDIAGLTDITIKAVEKTGYRFSRFVDGKGNIYKDNPIVLTSVTENQTLTAIFTPEVFEISAQATPVTGGKVTVSSNGGPRREGSNTVSYGATVELEAIPSGSDFIFRYFEDENGNRYKGTSGFDGATRFNFSAVNGPEKYMAVFAPKEVSYTIDVDPVEMKSGEYVAGNYEVTYEPSNSTSAITPDPFKKKEVISNIKAQTDIKIRAIPLNGYHFVRFVDSKGNNYTDNPLILHDVVADERITIVFDDDELTVNAVSSPDEGGTVTINGKAGTNKVKYDELVTLSAKPKEGTAYRFWYFEDEDGNHYSGTKVEEGENAGSYVHTFNAVNPTTTYKAVFVRNTLSLEMICDPADIYDAEHPEKPTNGGVVVTYKNQQGEQVITNPSRNQINDIVGLSDVKIKAVESAGYKFSKFVDRTGKVYTDNPLVLPAVTENLSVTAIFIEDHWKIDTQASPENGGYVKIDNITKHIEGKTSLDVDYNDEIRLEAFPNTGETGGEVYRFLYWKDSHGTEYLANPLTFKAINGSETYTAHFAKANVRVEVEVMPEGTGTVRFNSEPPTMHKATYNTNGSSNVMLSANPLSDYEFLYWKDQDGNTFSDNPLVLVDIERDIRIAAVFDNKISGIKAVSSPASGGHIKKTINSDGSITLSATANKGYKFVNWKKGEKLLTMGTKYTVASDAVKNGDVYTAYFKKDSNYDAKSDITQEKFYREWRKVITPNYTVTRDSMRLLAMQTVAGLPQYNNSTPGLKSYGAVASAEAYFDERVAKDIARLDGVFGDAELMTAEGETLTPDMMPDIDIYQKAAETFTDKKFGKKYDTEILTVKKVLEPEGFDNKKRTYLWRYTGAEYKDNIYLLYQVDDKKPKYVTPIVDEDGVLKFTIDKLEDNDIVAVVRATIRH